MYFNKTKLGAFLVFSTLISTPVQAEVLSSSPSEYTLKQEAETSLSPEELWDRLIHPETWWHPDHTYSSSSQNLSLTLEVGGKWLEKWEAGEVLHGTITSFEPNKSLILDAPFGPLKDLDVTVTWSISIMPNGTGSKVVFHETAYGNEDAKLNELAPAVDFVKTEAIKRLTQTSNKH
ncbi:SRPBCC family protein [Hirschia maritima]|uniref:SRPBCC family protein n=1 Tax=Hirschia maritima TaxID=1121961 RepID=UPI00039D492B|nr:hypothetical protein [Hirschia maritima]